MTMDTSYEELLILVRHEFELDDLNFKPKLSYWLSSQLSIFSLNARPPVVITSSMGVRNFLEVMRTAPHLNMLLSLDHESSAAEGTIIRKQCGLETGKGKAIARDENIGDVPRVTLGRIGMGGIGDAGTSDCNKFSGVRRHLFDGNDASCSNGAMRIYSVAGNAQGNCSRRSGLMYHDAEVSPDSNNSGLIRLADPGTPSLSVHSDGSNSGDVDVNNFLVSEEDDGFMREIAKIEDQCTQSRLLEGKNKCKETADGGGENENETSWTDAVVSSRSDDEDIYNDDYWSMVFDQDYPVNVRDPLLEKDTSLEVVERVGGSGSEDIGSTVLAYCAQRSEAALRSDENITMDGLAAVNDPTVLADGSPRVCQRKEGVIGLDGLPENVDGLNTVSGVAEANNTDSGSAEEGYGETSESSDSQLIPRANGSNVVRDDNIVDDASAVDPTHFDVERSRDSIHGHSDGRRVGGPRIEVNNMFTGSLHLPDADNGGTVDPAFEDFTQRRDAEPVFDDVYQLTNTNGCATVAAEEDAIYIGRVFKDKAEMQNTLAIYAIKRLFHFRLAKSEPERIICVCVDPLCAWRVFGHSVSKFSKNFEIRTATLTHTCSITARSQYEK
ncbi:PREDICTED: uncharacterized protein LOC104723740 [Camelina sativa]|uniref:Uncharacterized protein LOC104723740 n=1 Tax=Camelina sativa TaxID=90675 RepID=A0ABM0UFM0_CAMSA|nr:PREDICTED: uncharacterized protein LOC104723740 [Camelina sativa]XP_010440441.1 PREDICTED: uncharacterized protein LOC104723740 [Camelina sativa]